MEMVMVTTRWSAIWVWSFRRANKGLYRSTLHLPCRTNLLSLPRLEGNMSFRSTFYLYKNFVPRCCNFTHLHTSSPHNEVQKRFDPSAFEASMSLSSFQSMPGFSVKCQGPWALCSFKMLDSIFLLLITWSYGNRELLSFWKLWKRLDNQRT